MGTMQTTVEKADQDLIERIKSNPMMPRAWISNDYEPEIVNLGVELIAITDVYPLKKRLLTPTTDTEYFELIKLKTSFFHKVMAYGNSLLINQGK